MSTGEEEDDLDLWIEEHEEASGEASVPDKVPKVEASSPGEAPQAEASSPGEAPVAEASAVPSKTVGEAIWDAVLKSYEAQLINEGKKAGGLGQLRSGAKTAIRWLVSKGFTPAEVTTDQVAPLVAHIDTILKPPMTYVTKRAGVALIEEAVAMQNRPPHTVNPPVAPTKKREEMAQQPPEETEEQYEEQQEEQEEEPSQGEVQKARRQATRQPQVLYVTTPPRAPRQAPRAPAGPNAAVRRVLGTSNGSVRIHRRGPRGQRIYIEDVPVADITSSMAKFIKDFVEPNQPPDPSGANTYEVSEVGADNQEKGQPQVITVQSEMTSDPNEPLAQARQVMDFMAQMREDEEARKGQGSEVLKAAQTKAAASGDTNSLILMMMMERMMAGKDSGNSEAVAMKLLEGFKRSNAPAFDMPHYPPPPPVQMMPPPPPPPSELAPIVGKLLEATIANKVEPKPEKSFMEQMKELMAFKEMLAPTPTISPEIVMLRAEMAAMRAAQSQPKAAVEGGIEGALQTFTKLSDVVKTLAPQINAGGLTGTLQSILTPKLASAVGDMLAGGIQGARAAAPPQAQLPAQAPGPQAPQGPRPPPAAVVPLVAVLRAADTEPKQVQATLEVLQGYYSDPSFAPQMEPALQALFTGNREPGIRIVMQVLGAHRPELSKADFAGKVIDALIASATGQAPQSEPPKPLDTPTETVPMPATAEAKIPDVETAPPLMRVEAPPTPAEAPPTPAEAPVAVPAAQQTVEAAPSEAQSVGPTFASGKPVDPKDMPLTVPALADQDESAANA